IWALLARTISVHHTVSYRSPADRTENDGSDSSHGRLDSHLTSKQYSGGENRGPLRSRGRPPWSKIKINRKPPLVINYQRKR
ncbi:hypothetical protein SDJN02_20796, partial [Cucurbita argyrosperma subsp. argyrosperma]